jgi:Bacterial regulatory helix-turn-helix protein, lysR family
MARNETKYMESVIVLSEELNFTLAAQKMHVSQPVISRNIAELEAKLGGRLFDRDRKKVQLNKAGRAYVEHARIALLYGDQRSRPPAPRCRMRTSFFMLAGRLMPIPFCPLH